MSADFSWTQPAEKYIAAYRDIARGPVQELLCCEAPAGQDEDVPQYMTA